MKFFPLLADKKLTNLSFFLKKFKKQKLLNFWKNLFVIIKPYLMGKSDSDKLIKSHFHGKSKISFVAARSICNKEAPAHMVACLCLINFTFGNILSK